jgi:pSer/pThr/pTyr-binding forkhead associated (FHA) protein
MSQKMTHEQASGAYLVLQRGGAGKRIELWKECTTIGRSRECDIFLQDITVHRKQASILWTLAGYILRDDNGSDDSLVNGRSVTEHLLNNGDELTFGNSHLIFHANEGTRPFQLPVSRGRELHIGRIPDAQPAMPARLDLMSGSAIVQSIELMPKMTIGRSRKCSIFLEDLAVSRLHTTIDELPNGDYELVDNHSATGTFVNGRAMARCVLHDGDVVQIGASSFVFRLAHI